MIEVLLVCSSMCSRFFYVSKNEKKKKQRMKREVYGGNQDRNIEKNVFMIFGIISKTK